LCWQSDNYRRAISFGTKNWLNIFVTSNFNRSAFFSLFDYSYTVVFLIMFKIKWISRNFHKIVCFRIGTHFVICQRQSALGCVYKMIEINKKPRIKLNQEVEKVIISGRKDYKLYGSDGYALIDLLQITRWQKIYCKLCRRFSVGIRFNKQKELCYTLSSLCTRQISSS